MVNEERLNQVNELLAKEDEAYRKKVSQLRAERDAIERDNHLREAQKLLGKCFRYSNSYGSGDRWWIYYKVIGIDKEGIHDYKVISIQEPSYPELEIKIDFVHKDMFQQIVAKRDFDRVFNKAIEKLQKAKSIIHRKDSEHTGPKK